MEELFKYKDSRIAYRSFRNNVIADLDKSQKLLRTKAAKYLQKKIKDKINIKGGVSEPGQPPHRQVGDLIKGVKYQHVGDETRIGMGPPAYHAHLLEFGTEFRYAFSRKGKTLKEIAERGQLLPRPFLQPTFEEESEAVKEILSERWA
jgi:HK97 gp10 family phage protein